MMNCINLLVVTLLCAGLQLGSTTFTVHPDNLTVVLGANASFHCGSSSPGRTIAWLVTFTTSGDTLDSTNNNDAEQLVIRGITIQTSSRMATNLIVLAVEGNNNTIVQCRRPFPTTFSYKGSLMVLGPPSKPEPQLTVVNISSLKVEWFTPYSWANHSVIQYDMTLENSSASTNKVQTWTSNHTEFYISAPVTEGQRNSCDLLVINVTASSDIGQSQVGSVSGGFPIAPGPLEFLQCGDECRVTFLNDGTPQVKAKFKLPYICSYQTGQYEVSIIEDEFPNNKTQVLYGNYTESNTQSPVTVTVTSGLKINRTYSIVATVSSCQGNSSNNFSFSTDFTLLNVKELGQLQAADVDRGTLIGITAGVVVGVLALVVLLITAMVIVLKNRKGSRAPEEVSLDDMLKKRTQEKGEHYTQPDSNNRTYETIDSYQSEDFKRFVHTSAPNTSPTVPPRSSKQFRLSFPTGSTQPFNADVAVLQSQQVPQRVSVTNDDIEAESVAYLQLLSHGSSSESCSADPADPAANQVKRNSGSSNDEYTTMNSVGSLRNQQTRDLSAVNQLALSTFNEDNYMVFIEP